MPSTTTPGMLYPAPRSATLGMAVAYSTGVDSAYWLFSQTNITGSFHTEARFILSWSTPWLAPPSPKKATATLSVPFTRLVRAAPTARGTLAPTTPLVPSIPLLMSAMCIDPPLPLLHPVALPNSSATISLGSTPLAMQWPWPRWVLAM